MTLPRFLSRIADAAGPLLTGLDRSAIGAHLQETTVALRIQDAATLDGHAPGFLLAVNLAARLYPNLVIEAPTGLLASAYELAQNVNPGIDFADAKDTQVDAEIIWGSGTPSLTAVTVACTGWVLELDQTDRGSEPCVAVAAMAAAAIAMGEVFRIVFARHLEHGRAAPTPSSLDLVTLIDADPDRPTPWPTVADLGRIHLAGCGAIGQAAVAALAQLPVSGTLVAIDHDTIDLGNLQRYVLTTDADESTVKPVLIERALAASTIDVEKVETRWGDDDRSGPGVETVLSALDSPEDRIGVQASLPREVFNAWTSTDDIGVSRHEHFGKDPCLACLYWPRGPRPNRSELIAQSLRQHELRVLSYLGNSLPVGVPIPEGAVQGTFRLPLPDNASEWSQRSLLADVGNDFKLDAGELGPFTNMTVDQLYRDGICAGMLMRPDEDHPDEAISVPLAHQSALAGILLAVSLYVARVPELRSRRPALPQARYDVLRDSEQHLPVSSTRRPECFCHDPDFIEAYNNRWMGATTHQGKTDTPQ
jgi:hypothetical protein